MPYLHKSRPVWPDANERTATHHVVRGRQSMGFPLALWGGKDVPPSLTCGSPDRRQETGDCLVAEIQIRSAHVFEVATQDYRPFTLTVKPQRSHLLGLFYSSIDSMIHSFE